MARPNTYFSFKQFTIHQEQCAMKVGTDGVLLGAWADVTDAQQILDVGTGTGLIALMLAQRTAQSITPFPVQIHAIEIDQKSAQQAQENVASSPWHACIKVSHCALQSYVENCQATYDLIVANPPFFENAYKAPDCARTLARHTDTLTPLALLHAASQLLTAQGHLSVIYPVDMAEKFLVYGHRLDFVCSRRLHVKPTPKSPVKRILLDLVKNGKARDCQEETLVLEERRHVYTPEFTRLVKNFYLKL